jgi:hypothetical protein
LTNPREKLIKFGAKVATRGRNVAFQSRLCENSGDLSAVTILVEISPVLVGQACADHQK